MMDLLMYIAVIIVRIIVIIVAGIFLVWLVGNVFGFAFARGFTRARALLKQRSSKNNAEEKQ